LSIVVPRRLLSGVRQDGHRNTEKDDGFATARDGPDPGDGAAAISA